MNTQTLLLIPQFKTKTPLTDNMLGRTFRLPVDKTNYRNVCAHHNIEITQQSHQQAA